MKNLILLTTLIMSISSYAKDNQTKISQFKLKNNQLIRLNLAPTSQLQNQIKQSLPVRVIIKKFIVTKSPGGVSVKYSVVCEFPANVNVIDLREGGLVQEQVYGSCESTKDGRKVSVFASGMVYDSIGYSFTDEEDTLRRNFFSHFYLESSEILFGLGDFNLGTTYDLPFKHWMSELSTDSAGGNFTSKESKREGFITSIRYGKY